MVAPMPEFPPDVTSPATYAAAVAGMVDRPFLASQRWQEQQGRAVRDGAHPAILEFERAFIRRMSKLGIPVFASEVMRSAKRQDELHALGNSKARGGRSPHQWGCAVDLVHSVRGWSLSAKEWEIFGHVGEEVAKAKGLKLNWGGVWEFFDPAHWEIEDWQDIKLGYPEWLNVKR